MNTETTAKDIAADRAADIEDMQDVYWYVDEVHAHTPNVDREAVAARVAAILGISK